MILLPLSWFFFHIKASLTDVHIFNWVGAIEIGHHVEIVNNETLKKWNDTHMY